MARGKRLSEGARLVLARLAAEGPLPTARITGPDGVSGVAVAGLLRRGLVEEVEVPAAEAAGGVRWRVRITPAGREALHDP